LNTVLGQSSEKISSQPSKSVKILERVWPMRL